MPLSPPEYRKTEFTHRRGLASARPAAADVLPGTLYYSTDTGVLERSTGSAWESYSGTPSGSSTLVLGSDHLASLPAEDEIVQLLHHGPIIRPNNAITITSTGSLDLDIKNADVVYFDNASLAQLQAISKGYDGQVVMLVSLNALVELIHQSGTPGLTGSKLTNYATTVGAGTPIHRGAATYVYNLATNNWVMVHHDQGRWVTPTFNAADFTASGSMTWTVGSGDIQTDRYMINGKRVVYQFSYQNTTVGGTPSTDLRRAYTSLLTPAAAGEITVAWSRNLDNGTANDGFAFIYGTGGAFINIRRDKTSGNWAASTDNTYVQGTVIWEIA